MIRAIISKQISNNNLKPEFIFVIIYINNN